MKPEEVVVKAILDELERGVIPWRRAWSTTPPINAVSGKEYQGINHVVLSFAARTQDPRFLTYRQAKELGGHVRRGEHGYAVVFWKILEREVETEIGEEAKREIKKVPLLRYYTVFSVSQCEGIAEDKIAPKASLSSGDPIEAAERIVAKMPNPPAIKAGGNSAMYSPSSDTVFVPSPSAFVSPHHYYATLFHELIHSTAAPSRLNRRLSQENDAYSLEELIAEIGAAMLCAKAGILDDRLIENSAAYIKSWSSYLLDRPREIIAAASSAEKAKRYILGEHDEAKKD